MPSSKGGLPIGGLIAVAVVWIIAIAMVFFTIFWVQQNLSGSLSVKIDQRKSELESHLIHYQILNHESAAREMAQFKFKNYYETSPILRSVDESIIGRRTLSHNFTLRTGGMAPAYFLRRKNKPMVFESNYYTYSISLKPASTKLEVQEVY